VWDSKTCTHIATLQGHSCTVSSAIFSADGLRVASASEDKTVRLWDSTTGAHIATLKGHSGSVFSVTFSPDGSRLASVSEDNTVRLWNGNTGAHIATFAEHCERVMFSADGVTLALVSKIKMLQLRESKSGHFLGMGDLWVFRDLLPSRHLSELLSITCHTQDFII